MNDNDLLQLSAYIDNELSDEEQALLEQRLQQEPGLRRCLDELRLNDAALQQTFNPIAQEPLPDDLVNLITGGPEQDDKQGDNVHVLKPKTEKKAFWSSAIAASVLLGLGFLVGEMGEDSPSQEMVLNELLQPSPALVQVLGQQASGTITDISERQIKLELSFMRQDGSLCRQYLKTQAGYRFHGIACREQGNWNNMVISPVGDKPEESAHYQLANGANDSAVSSYITNNIRGIPLSLSEERQQLQ